MSQGDIAAAVLPSIAKQVAFFKESQKIEKVELKVKEAKPIYEIFNKQRGENSGNNSSKNANDNLSKCRERGNSKNPKTPVGSDS